MAKTLQFRRGTTSELAAITPAAGEILIDTTLNTIKIGNDTVEGGKVINGLAGTSYIYVTGNGASSIVNGEELLAAYNLAKTMTPFGSSLSDQNRIAIVIAPGRYYVSFSPNGRLDIDTQYVDIISLTGERDVFIEGNINITANDVLIRGLYSTYDIYVDSNLSALRMENCLAYNLAKGNVNLDNDVNISGTFIDCEAQNNGFATDVGGTASGTFINCKAFTGFGSSDGNASGVFTNCTTSGGGFAFSQSDDYGIADGTFTNCVSPYESFGGGDFGSAPGVFTNCVGGNGSFAGYQSGPGTFSGTIEGKLYYCRLTDGEFAPTSGNGKLHYCIDGNGNEVTSGGGLGGTSYVYVAGDKSSAIANGQQLLDAYALAKTMTPFDSPLGGGNRIQVVVAPGTYDLAFTPNNRLDMDTQYVDIVSSSGERDVFIVGNINITADNVLIRGLHSIYDIYVDTNLYYLRMENCFAFNLAAGDVDNNSINLPGTFIDCEAQNSAFGSQSGSTASGTFINCKAYFGFGYYDSDATGLFTNCFTLQSGFGNSDNNIGYGIASGTFTNCTAGWTDSFGGGEGGAATGVFTNCSGNSGSFAGYQTGPGTFSGTIEGTLNYCRLTSGGGEFAPTSGNGKLHYCIDGNGNEVTSGVSGLTLNGTSYVYVAGDKSTAVLNGEELLDAYASAKTMTPYGQFSGPSNRVKVVVAPGTYEFPNDDFNIDSNYVDVVSLTGNRDVVLDFINVTSGATDVYLKGLDLGTNAFTIYGNQPNLKIENCAGGDYSFSGDTQSTSGTFTNCTAGDYSFGGRDNGGDIGYGYIEDGAVCINCTAGDYSFGGNQLYIGGTADGTFINCTAGDYSFGGTGFTNGTFTDCVAGQGSFGGDGNVVGTYTGCTAGNYSFGGMYLSSVSGTFNNCIAGNNSFGEGGATVSGTFNNCTAGNNSFGQNLSSTVSGTFNNCTSGSYSFGAGSATVSGTFKNCYAGESSFGGSGATVTSTAFFSNCRVDNGLGFNFGGGVSGTFAGRASHCYSSGSQSFGQGGLTGRLEYCVLVNASLPVVTSPGRTFLCVDSLGINNQ